MTGQDNEILFISRSQRQFSSILTRIWQSVRFHNVGHKGGIASVLPAPTRFQNIDTLKSAIRRIQVDIADNHRISPHFGASVAAMQRQSAALPQAGYSGKTDDNVHRYHTRDGVAYQTG